MEAAKTVKTVLEDGILEGIKPFSGDSSEMSVGERLISEGKAIQKVQTQYTTAVAVQEKRSMAKIVHNVIEEAKLAGASFYYRWPVKNKKTGKTSIVQGGSVDLAMCVARNYGNCAIDIEGTETPTHYMLKGVFIDLETGFTVPRLYRQRKGQNIGDKYGEDRSEDIVFQIAQSKAQRNAIIKAMPAWLIDRAIDAARQAEIDKIKPENLSLARSQVIAFFEPYGIAPERIEQKMERKADEWTAENIADLRGMATGLKEGRISADELFPKMDSQKPEDATEQAQEPETTETMPTDDLFTWIKKARPGSSPKNREIFKKTIQNNFLDINAMPEGQQDYIKQKWAKTMEDEPWPFPEKAQEGLRQQPEEENWGESANADNSGPIERVEFYEKVRQAKAIFAENGKMHLYIKVLGDFGCETMNDIPPEKEEEFLSALGRAIDQMNEG